MMTVLRLQKNSDLKANKKQSKRQQHGENFKTSQP